MHIESLVFFENTPKYCTCNKVEGILSYFYGGCHDREGKAPLNLHNCKHAQKFCKQHQHLRTSLPPCFHNHILFYSSGHCVVCDLVQSKGVVGHKTVLCLLCVSYSTWCQILHSNQNLSMDLKFVMWQTWCSAQRRMGERQHVCFTGPQVTYNNYNSNKCYLDNILQCKKCLLW